MRTNSRDPEPTTIPPLVVENEAEREEERDRASQRERDREQERQASAPAEEQSSREASRGTQESIANANCPLVTDNPPAEAAGWTKDPENAVAVWLPSWFRDGTYSLRVEVPARDGVAHGTGRVVLTASEPGDSDRTFEGRFFGGHFYGDLAPDRELYFLPTDDFLYRLPDSPEEQFSGIVFWLRTEFGVQIAADPCYVRINGRPDLLVTVPSEFPVSDEAALEQAMREGWRVYQEHCPDAYHADVFVLPLRFHRERQKSARIPEYSPLLAKASFYGRVGEGLSVGP